MYDSSSLQVSQRTFQSPLLEGLRDLVLAPESRRAFTNSERNFHFWFEEIGSGTAAQDNNLVNACAVDRHRRFLLLLLFIPAPSRTCPHPPQ